MESPVSLKSIIDAAALAENAPCESQFCLGSFWTGSTGSYESRLAKSFKECVPTGDFRPHIDSLCRFYCDLICARLSGRIDYVVRVLSSSELRPEPGRPLALLQNMICARLGARDAGFGFYRSEPKLQLRSAAHLSGPDALRQRISYVADGLFVRPSALPGRYLLIDDILNTGASARVYAYALKRLFGAQGVVSANLAAARFNRGKDGKGYLKLDTAEIERTPGFAAVWADNSGVWHRSKECAFASGKVRTEIEHIARRTLAICAQCAK